MAARRHLSWGVAAVLLVLTGVTAPNMCSEKQSSVKQDINAVLARHDQRLLAIPGVVGVYVGVLDDDPTPCLKVMVSRPDPKLAKAIPREIEGYRVITEVTGGIKPMGGKEESR